MEKKKDYAIKSKRERKAIPESPFLLFQFFNWLLKRVPYTLAVVVPNTIWAIFAAIFGFFLVLARADFETTGTEKVFLYTLSSLVGIAALLILLEFGFLRFFGIKRWEGKEVRLINDKILNGRVQPDLSNQTLLEVYTALDKIHDLFLRRNIEYTNGVVIASALIEGLVSGQLKNVPSILIGGFIAVTVSFICTVPLYELLFSPIRRECKMLLNERKIPFKEKTFLSLRIKSVFFIILTFLALGIFLILIPSLEPMHIGFFILTLFITTVLSILVFDSIYKAFIEIEESAKDLRGGKRTSFLSGGLDKEIIDLSQNLNLAASAIHEFQKKLEIQVEARTKELEELSQSLDRKVKQRTKELQERVNQLERFQRLTVGREIRMGELKKEIEKLKKELEEKK